MALLQLLREIEERGVTLTAAPVEPRLRFWPASALNPKLVEELREHKESILEFLARQEAARQDTNPCIGSAGEVLEMAREHLGPVEDPIVPPAPPGLDPLAQRHGGKVEFFRGDWRGAEPRGFRVQSPDGAP